MEHLRQISLFFFIFVIITIISRTDSSSSGGGRFRSSGWSNYQARQRSFQPWHNRRTNTRQFPVRQRSGDDSDNSDDSSNSGRRPVRPRPTYPYGENGFPGRPPTNHVPHKQPQDPNPFYQNNVKPNPQPNPYPQTNVQPQPKPDPNPFYQNNAQPNPKPDPNPFYQNNAQPQPNPIYGTGIQPQPQPSLQPVPQDPNPFYQNNIQPQPQDPNPFYQNNIQPLPQPDPIYGSVAQPQPQPTLQTQPKEDPNPFYTNNIQSKEDPNPFYTNNIQPQPGPVYTNNIQPQTQPQLQPGPMIDPTIVRSDLPDIVPGPVLQGGFPQQPYIPGGPPNPQAALDPNDFYEQNDPNPVVPKISEGPRIIRVTSPKLYVGTADPDAFYNNNNNGSPDPVTTGNQPLNPPILIRDNPVINPVFDRPLYAAGVDPDAEVTILTGSETTPKTTTEVPAPPKETPPTEEPEVIAPIPDITPQVGVQNPKLHADPLHVNEQIPDAKPPKGVKNPVKYDDPLIADEPIPKTVKNPIIHDDMSPREPNPDELIPKTVKNPIIHDDMSPREPNPDELIPKTVKTPIIHDDMSPREPKPDDFIPVTIQNPLVYDNIGKKETLPDDSIPPPTVANPTIYDDSPEKVEPGTWEITQCYTGALVCPNNCDASTFIAGVRHCCPGCSGYKIHVENDVCKCLRKIDVIPTSSAFDDLNPDVINTQPDRGDVAYWTRGSRGNSASTNNNAGDIFEPLIGGTARLVGNELPTDIVFNPPSDKSPVVQTPIKRDPVFDEQILNSIFGNMADPPTTTPINQVKLDEFIQSVYSNGNPFEINAPTKK